MKGIILAGGYIWSRASAPCGRTVSDMDSEKMSTLEPTAIPHSWCKAI